MALGNYSRKPKKQAREEIIEDPFAGRLQSPIYRFFDRIWFLVKLHIAMLGGTAAGLGVLGIFPSLFAAADLCNDSLEYGDGDLFRPFFESWKKHFKQANLFALFVYGTLAAGFGIWYLLWYVRSPVPAILLNLFFFLAGISLLLILLYYPVLRLFFKRWTAPKTVIFSVLFGFGHFASSLLLLAVVAAWTLFALLIPQFAVFLLFSVIPWAAVVVTRRLLPLDDQREDEPDTDDHEPLQPYPSIHTTKE